MSLGQIYFYVLTGLVMLFGFFTIIAVEDIKLISVFRKLAIISLALLLIGIVLIKSNLAYLTANKTLYIFSVPLMAVLINRGLFWLHDRFFGEPFVFYRGSYMEGFWYIRTFDKKNLSVKQRIYCHYYSALHWTITLLFVIAFFYIN